MEKKGGKIQRGGGTAGSRGKIVNFQRGEKKQLKAVYQTSHNKGVFGQTMTEATKEKNT